jgi:glycosyltransferase involved in cell wall biosynthesis
MTVVEAMSCGVPVVVAAAGGVTHLVPPDGARLFPPGDGAALARALTEILQEPALQHRMARASREHALRVFAWPRLVDRLEEVYRHVMRVPAEHPPRTTAG